ncbi:class I SAM-dependent methyltransferase [Pleomorphomonas oryzae]|uniref:class I SAM-dependent methyltransferase n=1 Tax=Pleomorphomonas oryzae TaxID=261934 RepID=UPI000402CC67|nr:class I SAM-dependent methyltransferase [Pleomorphomonas oryzae]
MTAPTTSAGFDAAYRAPLTLWGDIRVPREVKAIADRLADGKVLELGCGLGRFSQYLAERGLDSTGVDFSPVAIDKASARVAGKARRANFMVADVTNLHVPGGPFDAAFDIGCFHCLDAEGQAAYAAGAASVLKPGATLLIWGMETAPSDQPFTPDAAEAIFEGHFRLVRSAPSRRRFARSYWLWLERL